MSKAGAFFGDTLRIKPIVSPFSEGARKMGVVRRTKDQVQFAFRRLESELPKDRKATLLLEYSDNEDWLGKEIKPEIERRFPQVKVHLAAPLPDFRRPHGAGFLGDSLPSEQSPTGRFVWGSSLIVASPFEQCGLS